MTELCRSYIDNSQCDERVGECTVICEAVVAVVAERRSCLWSLLSTDTLHRRVKAYEIAD